VILFGVLAPQRSPFEESVLYLRVWPNDIDLNFHLNDGRYMSLMGLGRADLLIRSGMLRRALKRKWAPVVGGSMIRYRREALPFARVTLHSRMLGWDDKWFYIGHTLERAGKISAVSYVRGVFRGPSGAIPTKDVLDLVGWTGPSPELPAPVTNWPELEAE
jgi:acyl-CoA thioesterase FadM